MISSRFLKSYILKNLYLFSSALLAILILLSFANTSKRLRDFGRCSSAFQQGDWIEGPEDSKIWSPRGCIIKRFKPEEVQQCYKNHNVYFIGDNSIRDKYYSFLSSLKFAQDYDQSINKEAQANSQVKSIQNNSINIKYHFDPYLNGTEITSILSYMIEMKNTKTRNLDKNARNNEILKKFNLNSKTILITGTGHFFLRNNILSGGVLKWKKTIDNLISTYSSSYSYVDSEIKLFVSPVVPVIEAKLKAFNFGKLHMSAINWMNIYLLRYKYSVFIPLSWADMIKGRDEMTTDGLRYLPELERYLMDIINNQHCNTMEIIQPYPFEHYCCSNYPPPSLFTISLLFVLFVFIPAIFLVKKYGKKPTLYFSNFSTNWSNFFTYKTLQNTFIFGVVLFLAFLTDRTPLFENHQKLQNLGWFWAILLAFATYSYLSIEDQKDSSLSSPSFEQYSFEELRGFIVALLTLFNYTGINSKNGYRTIYLTLVGTLMFSSGFSSFEFFSKRANLEVAELFKRLLDINLSTLALCYFTNTPYFYYSVVMLETIVLLITFIIMKVKSSNNSSTKLTLYKISAGLLTFMAFNSLGIFKYLVYFSNLILRTQFDPVKFQMLFSEHIYHGFLGIYVRAIMLDQSELYFNETIVRCKRAVILTSGFSILLYMWFVYIFSNQVSYYTSYCSLVSVIPIASFVLIQQVMKSTNKTSKFLSSISHHYYEILPLQLHLLMINNGSSILLYFDIKSSYSIVYKSNILWLLNMFTGFIIFFCAVSYLSLSKSYIVASLAAFNSTSSVTVVYPNTMRSREQSETSSFEISKSDDYGVNLSRFSESSRKTSPSIISDGSATVNMNTYIVSTAKDSISHNSAYTNRRILNCVALTILVLLINMSYWPS